MSRLLIIGGSDAGTSAALRAREIDAALEITLALADRFPSFSVCGLPYFISGQVPEAESLAHHLLIEFENRAITVLLEHRAASIHAASRRVEFEGPGRQSRELEYDDLVIATGAQPVVPSLPGVELDGVHVLRTIGDGLEINAAIGDRTRSAAIIGGGYLGLEMADALAHRGLSVTLLEQAPSLLTTVDPELGALVADELRSHAVRVLLATEADAIEPRSNGLAVRYDDGKEVVADLVLVLVGVRPDAGLAAVAGVELGMRGAIKVSRRMETNVDGIYAAGDCVETWQRLLQRPAYLPLGSTAHKQGRIAGENAAGGSAEYAGSLGTQVVKVFDLAVAGTGVNEEAARAAGFDPLTVPSSTWDRNLYYPGATVIEIRLVGDLTSGQLLGAQMIGGLNAQIAKRIDVLAAALYSEAKIDELNELDLSYTPPFGRPWDPIQEAAQTWRREALKPLASRPSGGPTAGAA